MAIKLWFLVSYFNEQRLTLREIILGKESFILSHTEFKRALLTGQLCILSLFVLLIFLLIDIYHQIYYSNATQVALIIIVIVCFILNRNQNYTASKIILGISINLTVFIFSTVEPEGSWASHAVHPNQPWGIGRLWL
ncbi:MAG: hypothetical protein IPK96_18620 [Flammeovirgaceae bacterium]|nr:hypothetical protein [Flammeovirgaceae bacterium]